MQRNVPHVNSEFDFIVPVRYHVYWQFLQIIGIVAERAERVGLMEGTSLSGGVRLLEGKISSLDRSP